MRELRERFFVGLLLTLALYLTFLNVTARAKPGAAREDAFAQSLERMQKLGPAAPVNRAFEAWLLVSLVASALVVRHVARRHLLRKEPLPDPLRDPPPWTVTDFALVFLISIAGQQSLSGFVRPHVVLEDGTVLEIDKPLSFGKEIAVPRATGESAAVERRQDGVWLRVPKVIESAPPVFVNGERILSGERPLERGDRLDVGGVRATLRAADTTTFLLVVAAGSLVAPLAVFACVKVRGASLAELGLQGFTPYEALRGVVGYFAMIPGVIALQVLAAVLCRRLGVPMSEHPLLKTLEHASAGEVGLLVLVAGVIAPISEEILFRGFLLRALRRPVPARGAAIFVASFFFAAFHPGFASLLPIFWVGSVFALLFTTSTRRSLLAGMVCHALFNTLNILLDVFLLRS